MYFHAIFAINRLLISNSADCSSIIIWPGLARRVFVQLSLWSEASHHRSEFFLQTCFSGSSSRMTCAPKRLRNFLSFESSDPFRFHRRPNDNSISAFGPRFFDADAPSNRCLCKLLNPDLGQLILPL